VSTLYLLSLLLYLNSCYHLLILQRLTIFKSLNPFSQVRKLFFNCVNWNTFWGNYFANRNYVTCQHISSAITFVLNVILLQCYYVFPEHNTSKQVSLLFMHNRGIKILTLLHSTVISIKFSFAFINIIDQRYS